MTKEIPIQDDDHLYVFTTERPMHPQHVDNMRAEWERIREQGKGTVLLHPGMHLTVFRKDSVGRWELIGSTREGKPICNGEESRDTEHS